MTIRTQNTIITLLILACVVGGFVFVLLMPGYKPASGPPEKFAEYHVEQLFTVEDRRVYRFYDNGHWHYLVVSSGQTSSVGWASPSTSSPPDR